MVLLTLEFTALESPAIYGGDAIIREFIPY
jgi:hypothetical protein